MFNWQIYRELNVDLIEAGFDTKEQIMKHWNEYGKNENRKTSNPEFNLDDYKKKNPELELDDPIEYELHYIRHLDKSKDNDYIFLIEHNGGGGLSRYNEDILSNISQILPDYKNYDVYTNSNKTIENVKIIKYDFIEALKRFENKYGNGILHINIFPNHQNYTLDKFKSTFNKLYGIKNLRIFITIHDYFWFYPRDPNIVMNKMGKIDSRLLKIIQEFFEYATLIIFPTKQVYDMYEKCGIVLDNINYKIIPHIDLKNKNITPYYQKIDDVIRVLFLGHFVKHKGSDVFKLLVNTNHSDICKIQYYVLGKNIENYKNDSVIFLGQYNDKNIFTLINTIKPHLILLLSEALETYSYTCTIVTNTGLPIFYNENVFSHRIDVDNGYKYNDNNVKEKYKECLIDLLNKGKDSYNRISTDISLYIPNEYKSIYN